MYPLSERLHFPAQPLVQSMIIRFPGCYLLNKREGNPNRFGGNFRFGASEAALTLEGPLFRKDKDKPSKTTLLFSVRRSYLQFLFELIGLPIRPDYWDYQWKVNHEINAYNTIVFFGIGNN